MRQGLTVATALASILVASGANGQVACPEGRTAAGQCVNAGLARTLRQIAVIHAHPKLSLTAMPVLPSGDASFRYPNALIPDPLGPSAVGMPLPPPPD